MPSRLPVCMANPNFLSRPLPHPGGSGSCHIFSDALNHASIVDGARLAGRHGSAQLHVFRHADMAHLAQLLAAAPAGEVSCVVSSADDLLTTLGQAISSLA